MCSISKKFSGNFILVSETQHILSDLQINYLFLKSPLKSIFTDLHLGFSLKEIIAPCPVGASYHSCWTDFSAWFSSWICRNVLKISFSLTGRSRPINKIYASSDLNLFHIIVHDCLMFTIAEGQIHPRLVC